MTSPGARATCSWSGRASSGPSPRSSSVPVRPRSCGTPPSPCSSFRGAGRRLWRMHDIDQTTDQMVRSVLAYAENRLRMDSVPLDIGTLPADQLYARLAGLIRDSGRHPDEVLGVYSSVIAPSIISADSTRFLGFIPAAPTKASLLFDMLVSCASIQGISWLEASGAIAAGCFVSGGSAGNLSTLAVARETAKKRLGEAGRGRRLRVVVSTDAHSS